MKTGRNDPCPCESGRKYKNCSYVTAEGAPLVFGKCLFDATSEAPAYDFGRIWRELGLE